MTNSIISAITGVFTDIGNWIVSALQSMIPIFWTEGTGGSGGSLTFLGVLAVCGLAFGVVFLVIGIIQRFLKFGA